MRDDRLRVRLSLSPCHLRPCSLTGGREEWRCLRCLQQKKRKQNQRLNLSGVFPDLIKVQISASVRLRDKTTSELIPLRRLAEVLVRFKAAKMLQLNIWERMSCSAERALAPRGSKGKKRSASTWQWKQALRAGAQRGRRVNLRVTCSYYTVGLTGRLGGHSGTRSRENKTYRQWSFPCSDSSFWLQSCVIWHCD